jgi:POT family proton-dependent oligopeptide transporter
LTGAAPEVPNPLPTARRPLVAAAAVVVVGLVAVAAFTGLLPARRLSGTVVLLGAAAAVAYFVVILSSRAITGTERQRVIAFIPMFICPRAAAPSRWGPDPRRSCRTDPDPDQRLS